MGRERRGRGKILFIVFPLLQSRKVDPNVKSVAVDVAVPLHLKGASKLPNTSRHNMYDNLGPI